MIQRLARQIVVEVRSRGPFLSLSEFVNRRIGPASDERSLSGAVESAITKASLNATNQRFGRAFKVVAFRWLAPEEV